MDKSRLLILLLLAGLTAASAQTLPPLIVPKPPVVKVTPDALFAGTVPKLELTISPENITKLTQNPRDYVTLTIKEAGGVTLEKCSVKLKGSAGSFRQITDERPGFSLRTAKSKKSQEYRGLSKFQLNNCAQDGTMLLEMIAGDFDEGHDDAEVNVRQREDGSWLVDGQTDIDELADTLGEDFGEAEGFHTIAGLFPGIGPGFFVPNGF